MGLILAYWWLIPAYISFSAVLWSVTWVFYLARMCVDWASAQVYGTPAKLAKPVVKTAEFLSTALNWLVFTVVLLELPKERFLSTRLARHKRQGKGWRQRLANRLGMVWLDPFDPNGHHI